MIGTRNDRSKKLLVELSINVSKWEKEFLEVWVFVGDVEIKCYCGRICCSVDSMM